MEVWANLKAKLIQRQMVVYQPWSGPRTRHTSHEKDYFEQRKSMIKFLREFSFGRLSETDRQTLHYLTNKCPLEVFYAITIKDHELDNWEKKINEFLEMEFEPTSPVINDLLSSATQHAFTALDWIRLKKNYSKK